MSAATINKYLDVKEILDAALAQNVGYGEVCGTVAMPSKGAAIHWRQRAYKFMKLWREFRDANSQYERLSFPQIADTEPWQVIIKMAGRSYGFTPAGAPREVEEDPLLAEARALVDKISGDDL